MLEIGITKATTAPDDEDAGEDNKGKGDNYDDGKEGRGEGGSLLRWAA